MKRTKTENAERREKYVAAKKLGLTSKESWRVRDFGWGRLAKLSFLMIELGYPGRDAIKHSKKSFLEIEGLGPYEAPPEEPDEWEDDEKEPDKQEGGSP